MMQVLGGKNYIRTRAKNQANEPMGARIPAQTGLSLRGFCLHGSRPQNHSAFGLTPPLKNRNRNLSK